MWFCTSPTVSRILTKIAILNQYNTEKPSSGLLHKLIKIKIYASITLSAALFGFETWSLTLREEHRPRVFRNRVLRRVFGPKWDGVTGKDYITRIFMMCTHQMLFGWPNREEWDRQGMWHVWGERRGVYRVLVGKPKGKRPLVRPRIRWDDNIKMDFHEAGWGYGLDWSGSG